MRKKFDFLFFEIKMSSAFLPLEIIVIIGLESLDAWRAMLAVPDFARWTQSSQGLRSRGSFLTCKKTSVNTKYYLRGRLHNFDDLPAVIWTDAHTYYFDENDFVQGGYSFPRTAGGSAWFRNGYLHRDNDLPAVIEIGGWSKWYQNGLLHRDDDRPAMISSDKKNMLWFKKGIHFRKKGPYVVNENDGIDWEDFDDETGIKWINHYEISYESMEDDKISREYFNEILNYYLNSWKTSSDN